MRRLLAPGEQVIAVTRQHRRLLVLPALVFVLACGAAAFTAGWLSRGHLEEAFPWMPAAARPWLMLASAVLAAWAVAAYSVRRFLAWNGLTYVLTNRRVLRRRRGLRSQEQEMPLAFVTGVEVRQGVLEGWLGSGTLALASGRSGQLTLADVPEVRRFRQFVLDAVDELPRALVGTDDARPGEGPAADGRPWERDGQQWEGRDD
ncbi:PH domain-containing protein [Sinomonas halotolerans]|uniref:PH domain-containing protein n=1 Tax=Sinomonas halotolerans TaxID=1644133 RepID=A0ABU9WV67_9MICC